jgi:transcriptional regulator with XRE-family HTH domain
MYSIEDNMPAIKDKTTERVARALRSRREQVGLTLRTLSAASGVSSSMISDIERGAKSPTISTLAALADALNVSISALVDSSHPAHGRIHVVRAQDRREIIDLKSGARRDSFRPTLTASKIEFMRYTIPPRKVAGPFAAHATGTVEHMHLAAGSIRAEFGEDEASLEAGDCCTCLADAPHLFDNSKGKVAAQVYIVVEQAM